jgi:hypothetical protein
MNCLQEQESLEGFNGILMVFDSLRYDSAVLAETPTLDKLGPIHKATTQAPYTPAAHTSMFLGHLPTIHSPQLPYYNETVRQPWRITTGPARDAGKGCGMLFQGSNVIEGYQIRGYYRLGIGGVSQFSTGSFLRTAFPWSDFIYYGPDMDEEPLQERDWETFPLNHTNEVASQLNGHPDWFLFINCPETHYPYDWGSGIPAKVEENFPLLKYGLNLRSHNLRPHDIDQLKTTASLMHQMQIQAMTQLDKKLNSLFGKLRQISSKPIYVFACADHGENFGEGGLFGHMHATKECLSVPLWMGIL